MEKGGDNLAEVGLNAQERRERLLENIWEMSRKLRLVAIQGGTNGGNEMRI